MIVKMLTEKRRIENARTPIRIKMKKERTLPKAFLKEVALAASEAAIDGQIELSRERERVRQLWECKPFWVVVPKGGEKSEDWKLRCVY